MPALAMKRLLAIGLILVSAPAGADERYPARPVRIIVPYAAGGSSDAIARIVAQRLSERLKQQFVVDNRAGAGTLIGTDIAAGAAADGYTVLVATPPFVINPVLYAKTNYVPERDFAAVTNIAGSSNLLVVHPSLVVASVQELVSELKARPGEYTYGSSGIGGAGHLAMALFAHMAQVQVVHVPYKGGAPMVADLLGGRLHLAMANLTTALPHIRSGRLRALAIGTARRSLLVPDMPTIAEAGVRGYEANNWNGFVVPRATPSRVIEALHRATAAVLREPDIAERVAAAGLDAIGDTPGEFTRYMNDERNKWGELVRTAGIRAE